MTAMTLTAHQPVYLPWLGLFHKIASADTFVSYNRVQYLPKDWNNRNRIKTSSGPIWLTVPVLRSGYREVPLNELEINNGLPWARKHWRSLSLNYKKAPYFEEYARFFEETYSREWVGLAELNEHMLKWFIETLGLKVDFHLASDHDFRGQKSDLVLDMCRQMGAARFIFGTQGRDYADEGDFHQNGIQIAFQNYKHPEYPQLHGDFVPFLSVIDLLFNCGADSLAILMKDQEEIRYI